jgi:hypothetical protein
MPIAAWIILARPKAYINGFFLCNRGMVGLGLISYPLYLWHWILLSFAQIWGPIFIEQKIILLLVSLLLSCLTYFFVEKPLRAHFSVQKKALTLALCMAIILGVGYLLNQNGFEQRQINQINTYEASAQDGGDGGQLEKGCGLSDSGLSNFFYGCLQDRREGVKFAIIGDSHAMSLFPGLVGTSTANNRWLAIFGPGGPQNLRPYLSNTRSNVSAKDSLYTDKAVEQINQNPNIQVVLLTFSSNSLLPSMANASEQDQQEAYKGFNSIIKKFISSNKKVVLLIDNPHLAQPQDCYHRQIGIATLDQFNKINPECTISIGKFQEIQEKYRKVLHDLAEAHSRDVFVFDATPYLCSAEEGICSYKKDGRRMYLYSDHLSDYAAGKVGEPINQYIRSIKRSK